ncbi:MAG: 3-methyl-2-oxobutanoate hydroxymethyltransferase [Thermoprotei archaeon]
MSNELKKITPYDFIKLKKKGEKIAMITAYDYYQSMLANEAGIDGILVGDSLGMVIMGFNSTLPVTMNMIKHHLKAVLNAKPKSLVVADMPFMSYEISKKDALKNASTLIRIGADAVKLEGGLEVIDKVEAMVKAGIPVMGHIGLNPQRSLIKGLKMRGKTSEDAKEIFETSKMLEEAGVFSIVIEYTAADVAKAITENLKIPTIGIGAGPWCDGQILVFHDVIGLTPSPPPFVKRYLNVHGLFLEALKEYTSDVKNGMFPDKDHYWSMTPEDLRKFKESIKEKA